MTMTVSMVPATHAAFLRRVTRISILITASMVLLGCQPLIEVVQPASPVASPVATAAPDERGIALMGVDFDPPLDAGQLIASRSVTLLVAIENKGQITESAVRVTARLLDPTGLDQAAELASETITVRALAPRELRVVRFTQVTELPVRERYKLVIEAAPLPGERERDDNFKTYDIIVRPTE